MSFMSVFKSVPVFSQVISFTQMLAGDLNGARETQEDFSKRCPIVSQVRSAIQAASGDLEGARATQEEFSMTCPVVSQIRSIVEVAAGDANQAYKTQEKFLQALLFEERKSSKVEGTTGDTLVHEDSKHFLGPTRDEKSKDKQALEDATCCCVCLERKKNVCFEPCHHVCCCELHASQVQICPICRAEISGRMTVFI